MVQRAGKRRARTLGMPFDVRRQLFLIGVRTLVIRGVPTPIAEVPLDLCHLAMAQIRAGGTCASGNIA